MFRGYDGAGVSYTELEVLPDFSGINTLSTGIIGGATRGPLTKTKITNVKQLRKIFGNPVEGDWGLWAAEKVLVNSNLIWYKRIVSADAAKGVGQISGKVSKYHFETKDFDEFLNGAKIVVTRKPGTSQNKTVVNDEAIVDLRRAGGTETVVGDEVTATLTRNTTDGETISLESGVKIHEVVEVKAGTKVYTADTDYTIDLTTGAITWVSGGEAPENEAQFTVKYLPESTVTVSGDVIPLSVGQVVKSIKNVFARIDGITYEYTENTDYAVNKATGVITWMPRHRVQNGVELDELIIPIPSAGAAYTVQFIPETTSTITVGDRYDISIVKNGQTLEKLTNFVIDNDDSDDYVLTALKERSDYITCVKTIGYVETAANAYPDFNGTYVVSGGNAGLPKYTGDAVRDAEIDQAYIGTKGTDEGMQDFLDPEALDISTMIIPGVFNDAVIQAATDVAESRGDIIYIAEMPEGLTPQQADKFSRRKGDWTPTLSNGLHVINSKFVAMYYPWILEYVAEWNKNVYTPPSAWVASQFAYNDTVAATWFAPAGFQSGTQGRGTLTSALGLEHNCTSAERDILYADDNGCVNPIVGFVGKGITIWGNKTTLRTSEWAIADSSWTQLSVRRLCNYCRKVIIKTSMETLFQPNTETYWKQWRVKVEQELQRIKEGDGIEAYRVQMDRSTISDEDLYYGRAPGKVFIKPVHAIEWIPITFTVTHDSVVFEEGNTSVEE